MSKAPLDKRLRLEPLEDRTCPTLTLALRTAGLFISGVPASPTLTINQTAPNRLQVMDGGTNLGSYTVPGGLFLNLTRYNLALNVDAAGFTYTGNMNLNVGFGG